MPEANPQSSTPPRDHRASAAGWLLLAATLLSVLAMTHHPSVRSADIAHALQQIVAFSTTSAVVHGVLMALLLVIFYAFSEFVRRRGIERPAMRAGAIAYGAGVLAMLGAALVSGFIVADIASMALADPPADPQSSRQLLRLCFAANQALAKLGVVAMSAGIGLWSIDLLADAGLRRWVGLLGCVVAALPALALFGGWLRLDVHGMTLTVLLQACWNIAIAVLLLRGRL